MRPYLLSLATIILLPAQIQAGGASHWQAVVTEDPVSQKINCLMVSSTQEIQDGQTSSPVHITYNGQFFFVRTESNIDVSYTGLGLQVDGKAPHSIDRVYKKTNVIFEKNSEQLKTEFIQGLNARLTLGFWPTWPKTKAYQANFNLKGFTKAYKQLLNCQQTGKTSSASNNIVRKRKSI